MECTAVRLKISAILITGERQSQVLLIFHINLTQSFHNTFCFSHTPFRPECKYSTTIQFVANDLLTFSTEKKSLYIFTSSSKIYKNYIYLYLTSCDFETYRQLLNCLIVNVRSKRKTPNKVIQFSLLTIAITYTTIMLQEDKSVVQKVKHTFMQVQTKFL